MARNSLGGFHDPGKPLPSNARNEIINLFNAGLGLSDIPRNTRVLKGAVYKIVRHYSVHATTQPFSCGGKIFDNGWHPWSNWLAFLPSAPCRRFLMLRVNIRKIHFVHRKKIVIFQSIYKNTFIQLKKGCAREECNFHSMIVHAWSALTVILVSLENLFRLVFRGFEFYLELSKFLVASHCPLVWPPLLCLFKSHFLRISRIKRHSRKIEIFYLFCQNVPLGKLIQEKIIQSSNELFNGRKFKKFEKCIKWRFWGL